MPKRQITRQYQVTTPLELDAHIANAHVRISGEDRITANVTVHIQSFGGWHDAGDEAVDRVAAGIVFEGQRLGIRSPQQDGTSAWHRLRLDYEIEVPRETRVELSSANGRTSLRNVEGPVRATISNAPASIRDISAAINVQLSNGPLEVSRAGADVEARVSNGPMTLEQIAGVLDLEVTNGPVNIEEAGRRIRVVAVNGPIHYRGSVKGDFDMQSRNGAIVLRLPSDSRFEIDAEAERGFVHSDFEVNEAGAANESAPKLTLRTQNGIIRLEREGGSREARVVVGVGTWA
jgi:hypothetical protein